VTGHPILNNKLENRQWQRSIFQNHVVKLAQVMQKLYLYEKIRRVHYQNPDSLPLRRKGVYLALDWGIQQGEQFLQWSDGALELLATVEST